ncbi:MAG: acylphosphatase, partial [Cyanobacteriota bacterium]
MNVPERSVRLRLLCRGTLQGVGFRPMVLRLGTSLALDGWVRNRVDGVAIELVGHRKVLEHFLALLPSALPATARLESRAVTWRE